VVDPSRVIVQRASYIMRLPASAPGGDLSVGGLKDLRTLMALLRAGSLLQRRAAVARIGELLSAADVADAWRAQAVEVLMHMRRFELAYEVSLVLGALAGSDGRAARAELKTWSELAARVEAQVLSFWDGDDSAEPIAALTAEERALLLSHVRGLSDCMARHVAALIEECAGLPERTQVRSLIVAIEHAGDPRLVPALRSAIEARDPVLLGPAARALGRIEDPRVQPILRGAFERAARTEDRLVFAAALGAVGDSRGLTFAREALLAADAELVAPALEALAELGTTDDVQGICELLDRPDESVSRLAVAALGRIADSRALVPLARLRERTRRSALRAEIEDAESAIHARMELLGEEAPSPQAAQAAWDTTKMASLARSSDPASVRARARLHLFVGRLCVALGMRSQAIARFEAAAALRAGWVVPVVSIAMLRSRHDETALSLAAFRRAIEIDRSYVEAHGSVITAMAQAFLRRAEGVEREGRLEIARGLVEEILSHDLREASARVRFALRERKEAQEAQKR
jgi:HEAT repeat protein